MYFPDTDIDVCTTPQEIIPIGEEQEWSQAYWSKIEKATKSGCMVPCTNTEYDLNYSYGGELNPGLGDDDAEFVLTFWFKNFRFEYKEEYVVCDWTCLVGEIGGNFGFFLGGSILLIFDLTFLGISKLI